MHSCIFAKKKNSEEQSQLCLDPHLISTRFFCRALHATGCDLYLTLRDPASQGASLVQDIKSSGLGQGKIEILPLQLDSLAAVRRCAEEFLQKSQQLNILILNAGACHLPATG